MPVALLNRNPRSTKPPLIEIVESFKYKIVEGTGGATGKPLTLEGIFQRADVCNENKRIYPRKIWERACSNDSPIMKKIQERGFFGELDHPEDGHTSLKRTSHIVTGLRLDESGNVWGRMEVLPTREGKELEALVSAETKIGISSRGSGECVKNGDEDIVQEDFELEAFDVVHNPSTRGAHPYVVNESKEKGDAMADNVVMESFRLLESSAQKILSIDVQKTSPEVRAVMEGSVTDLIYKLSQLAETKPEAAPLVSVILAELQAYKRGLYRKLTETDGPDEPSPAILKRLGAPGFDNVDVKPVTPGPVATKKENKKEGPMAATTEAVPPVSKRVNTLLRQMDAALKESEQNSDDTKAARHKAATAAVRMAENRLFARVNQFTEDDKAFPGAAPPFKKKNGGDDEDEIKAEGAPGGTSDIPDNPPTGGTDEFMQGGDRDKVFGEEDDIVDIPPPPMEAADDDKDDDEDDKDMSPSEAKIFDYAKKLMFENRKLRYQKQVLETVAAKSLADMTRTIKRLRVEKTRTPSMVRVRGQNVPLRLIPAVIESLVRKFKAVTANKTEDTPAFSGHRDPIHGSLPPIKSNFGALVRLHEGSRFGKNGPREKEGGKFDAQLELADRVYERMKPKKLATAIIETK